MVENGVNGKNSAPGLDAALPRSATQRIPPIPISLASQRTAVPPVAEHLSRQAFDTAR